MNTFFIWLDKNKTYLAAIALPVISFAVSLGMSPELGNLLAIIIGVITGGGKLVIDKAVKNESELGAILVNARVKRNIK